MHGQNHIKQTVLFVLLSSNFISLLTQIRRTPLLHSYLTTSAFVCFSVPKHTEFHPTLQFPALTQQQSILRSPFRSA